jgi:hypothetical protein
MRLSIGKFILLLSTLLSLVSAAIPAFSQTSQSIEATGLIAESQYDKREQIDQLTRQIVLKIIDLERFNIHYRMEVGKTGRWAGWRYAGLQEIQSCLNFAGSVTAVGERTSHFHDAEKLSVPKLETSNLLAAVGSLFGSSAAILEFGITEFHDIQSRGKGYSPKAARTYVLTIKNDLEKLILRRRVLIKDELDSPSMALHGQEHAAEERVLIDLFSLALLEFEKLHLGGRRFVAFQKSLYLFDMAKYACNGAGNLCAFMAQHRADRKWNLPAGILLDTGGALVIATPYVSRGIGIIAQEIQKHYTGQIVKETKVLQPGDLEADQAALEKIAMQTAPHGNDIKNPLKRISSYSANKRIFASEFNNIVRKEREGKLTATQTIIAGTLLGGCDLSAGILYTSVGRISTGKTARDARITNYNLGTAAIIGVPANAISTLDTLRIQVQAELSYRKAARENKLPSQLYSSNLKKLDQIEAELTRLP